MFQLSALSSLLALAAGSTIIVDDYELPSPDGPVVHVPGLGKLRGSFSKRSSDIAYFRGVPYALAPVGDRRWRPPVAFGAWGQPRSHPLDATAFGKACIPLDETTLETSEDCLFLNVATPTSALDNPHNPRPTLVYIHGGAYVSGSSSNIHPDAILAATGGAVVAVTLNYRLNIYGFLGADALRSQFPSTGNYGIQDQRMALGWVRKHIDAFGGDRSSVTIFGESAGGNSVLNHLVQPASFGLYDRAIIDSGTYSAAFNMDEANARYNELLNVTSCSDIKCLTQVSREVLDAFAHEMGEWTPVIDGVSLHDFPQAVVGHGKHNNRVPILIGTNRDEAAYFIPGDELKYLTREMLEGILQGTAYAANVSELLELYKFNGSYPYPSDLGDWSEWLWKYVRINTDGGGKNGPGQPSMGLGHCSARCVAKGFIAGGTPNVFFYNFQHPTKSPLVDVNTALPIPFCGNGEPFAPHASELPYVFALLEVLDSDNGEQELAQAMSAYWTNFAVSGDPNRDDLPAWPHWRPDTDLTQMLDVGLGGIASLGHLRAEACDFFDRQPNSVCMAWHVV